MRGAYSEATKGRRAVVSGAIGGIPYVGPCAFNRLVLPICGLTGICGQEAGAVIPPSQQVGFVWPDPSPVDSKNGTNIEINFPVS